MKKNVLGGVILFAFGLLLYHFYYAHVVKGTYPAELIFALAILLILGVGVFTKLIRLKNA